MNDSILRTRVESLRRSLKALDNLEFWNEMAKLAGQSAQSGGQGWRHLVQAIGKPARDTVEELDELKKIIDEEAANDDVDSSRANLQQAWDTFGSIYARSQDLFHESLDILAGLAFRGLANGPTSPDARLCRVADALIASCAGPTLSRASLTVPARQERLCMTMARLIRLRYPDWTIWTLPFSMHEFGHVALRETDGLKSFIEAWKARLLSDDDVLKRLHDEAVKSGAPQNIAGAKRQAEHHLYVFLADAFATYMMGPAYAAAALFVRFDPSTEHAEHPLDVKRARVVLGALKWLSEQANDQFAFEMRRLSTEWDDLLTRVPAPALISDAERALLDEFAVAACKRFNTEFYGPEVRYGFMFLVSGNDPSGWSFVMDWSEKWTVSLENGIAPTVPDESGVNKLRDVLNAAWRCRLNPSYSADLKKIDDIERVAVDLCMLILHQHEEVERSKQGSDRQNQGLSSNERPAALTHTVRTHHAS